MEGRLGKEEGGVRFVTRTDTALSVIAGLDPAIHHSSKMNARVGPAHDAGDAVRPLKAF
jgi:hypothetical protein